MANNDDKDILITPNSGQSGYPNISFKGYNADTDGDSITLNVLDDNTLSFESDEGQVFSIGPVLSSGTIFSVNDISGVPSITVDADGTITLAPYQDGNVGIGTDSPDEALEIMNGTLKITREETESSVVTEDTVHLDMNGLRWTYSTSFDNPNPVPIGTTTDQDVRIMRYNQTHQRFYWDRTYFSKKVGIGTTTIDAPLHVQSGSDLLSIFESTDANAGIQIDSPNDGYSVVFFAEGGTNKWSLGKLANNSDKFSIYDEVNNTPRLVIDTDGDVGIGTTSPSTALEVSGTLTVGNAALESNQFRINNTGGYAQIELGGSSGAFIDMKTPFSDDYDGRIITDGNGLDIIMAGASKDIRLMTNGTERFKVEDTVVTSSVSMTVNGSITVADNIIHSGDTNNTISFGTDTQSFNTGSTSRMNISDSGLQVGTGARVTTILDEDNMASNSATALATQQSIKAYVDSQSGGGGSPAGSDSQIQYNNGGSFGGDADFTWDDTNNRLVIGSVTSQHDGLGKLTVKGTDAGFLLEKHDDSASGGPTMTLYRYSASVADNDLIGQVNFRGEGSTGNPSTYISMRAEIEDTTEGTKDGALIVRGLINNTQTNLVEFHGSGLTLNQGTFNGNMGTTTYKPSVYMDTGTQNVNQTEATLGFNSEVLDPASNTSSTTDGHIRLAAGGYYRISYSIPINDDGSTGGDRTRVFTFMQVDDNNSFTSPTTVAQSRAQVYTRENSGGSGLSSSFIYQHTANDYIRLRIDAEGTTDISTESNQSQISIEYLGPA